MNATRPGQVLEDSMATNILLLDDDQRMFQAINRLVRPLDAAVLSANSVERALWFCQEYDIQVVIVDLNRRDIDVTRFLGQVSRINRLTRKIVLTSFAELDSTISAINSGRINRYFTKPWDAGELRRAIVEELEEYEEQDNASRKLRHLGNRAEQAEEKVDFTAKLLDGTAAMLAGTRYRAAISIFLQLLDVRLPGSKAFARRTTRLAGEIANAMKLPVNQREQIMLAAELHQIGLLAIPDAIIGKSAAEMTVSDYMQFQRYPEIGAQVLADEGQEDSVVAIVRHHREDMDGDGYPQQLVGGFIPIGARIVRVAADFVARADEIGRDRALLELQQAGQEVYDPQVIKQLTLIHAAEDNAAEDRAAEGNSAENRAVTCA